MKKVDGRGQDAEREFEVYIIVGGGVVVLVHFFPTFLVIPLIGNRIMV